MTLKVGDYLEYTCFRHNVNINRILNRPNKPRSLSPFLSRLAIYLFLSKIAVDCKLSQWRYLPPALSVVLRFLPLRFFGNFSTKLQNTRTKHIIEIVRRTEGLNKTLWQADGLQFPIEGLLACLIIPHLLLFLLKVLKFCFKTLTYI